jgi:hypothetical protein
MPDSIRSTRKGRRRIIPCPSGMLSTASRVLPASFPRLDSPLLRRSVNPRICFPVSATATCGGPRASRLRHDSHERVCLKTARSFSLTDEDSLQRNAMFQCSAGHDTSGGDVPDLIGLNKHFLRASSEGGGLGGVTLKCWDPRGHTRGKEVGAHVVSSSARAVFRLLRASYQTRRAAW